MSLSCGMVGLPNVGKSTLFQILTDLFDVVAANYPFSTIEPNMAKVPMIDPRLEIMRKLINAKRIIPETIEFVDIAGLVEGASQNKGMGNAFLQDIRAVDLIVHVLRCFESEDIVHVMDRIKPDPVADFHVINNELILADLMWLDKQIENMPKRLAKGNITLEEAATLKEAHTYLSASSAKALILYSWTEAKKNFLLNQGLLTIKPFLFVGNIDDDSSDPLSNSYFADLNTYATAHTIPIVAIAPLLEKEAKTASASPEEAQQFLREMGHSGSALADLGVMAQKALGYISYFTAGEKEVRAWSIKDGTMAAQAAGKIHSDLEKGFISAKKLSYDEFVHNNGWNDKNTVKDGIKPMHCHKDYIVKDGDVLLFLTSAHTK